MTRFEADMKNNILDLELCRMETDEDIKGKAYVHWKTWHEAYKGMISGDYLDKLTLEKCEKMAYSRDDNIIVAKDSGRVVGFVAYGKDDASSENGEIFALYVLSDYYGKEVGLRLMNAGLEYLKGCREIGLWVLKENARAIRFYGKCGFLHNGEEKYLPGLRASEIRMILIR